jgi:hypothetical protein
MVMRYRLITITLIVLFSLSGHLNAGTRDHTQSNLIVYAVDTESTTADPEEESIDDSNTLSISEYPGDKLLVCSGNPDVEKIKKRYEKQFGEKYDLTYEEDNKDWYSVDKDPLMRPNYVADLLKKESYDYLSQKKFDIIIDEYCVYPVSHELRHQAARLLKPGGILLSKVCAPSKQLGKIKKEMLQKGFSKVIFGSPNLEQLGPYWMKHMSKEQIIAVYKKLEHKKSPKSPCGSLGGDIWAEYLAIK